MSKQVEDVKEDHCRYIHGDPTKDEDWHYCGAPRARLPNGELRRWRWCDEHYPLMTARPAPYRKREKLVIEMDEAA